MTSETNKIPLVMLSGLLCDTRVWEPVAQRLADNIEPYIISFAGFERFSDMAEKVLSETPENFALAGHSMGGRVALEVYRKAPERVTRIALLNTGVHPVKESEIPGRQRLLDLADAEGTQALSETWLPPMIGPVGRDKPELVNNLKSMVCEQTVADFHGQIQALLNRPNAEEVLPLIRVPTLLLSGSEDAWSPIEQHKEMQKHLPGSELVGLDGVGHMSMVEAPEAVSKAILDWLQSPT